MKSTPKDKKVYKKDKEKKRHRSSSSSSASPEKKDKKQDGQLSGKVDLSTIYDLDADIHPSWTSSGEFLDFKEERGLALARIVRDTPMSRKLKINGKDIRCIRISDLCYKGMQNWYLRAISVGRFVNIEFTRSIKESIFISRILKNMRPKQNTGEDRFDLDKIGAAWAATNKKKFDTEDDKRII